MSAPRLRLFAAALVVAAPLMLGACTSSPSAGLTDLQSTVQSAAQAAAGGDYDAALAALDELEETAEAHAASGEITDDKLESILAASAQVRDDIAAVAGTDTVTETPTPTETTEESTTTTEDDAQDESNGNSGGNSGNNGNRGNGNNGNGKGKGNQN